MAPRSWNSKARAGFSGFVSLSITCCGGAASIPAEIDHILVAPAPPPPARFPRTQGQAADAIEPCGGIVGKLLMTTPFGRT
jgi:hypothetical protein